MANDEFDAWLSRALGVTLPSTSEAGGGNDDVPKGPDEVAPFTDGLGLDSKITAAPDGTPTYGNLPGDVPNKFGKILELSGKNGEFRIVRNGKIIGAPAGWYTFVVKDGRIFASSVVGHPQLAQGGRVAWAGQMKFSSKGGILERWDNASGHYLPSGTPSTVKNNPPPHPSLTWDNFVWDYKGSVVRPGSSGRQQGPQLGVIQGQTTGGAGNSGGDPKTKTPPTKPETPPTNAKPSQAPKGTKPLAGSPPTPAKPAKGASAGSPPPGPKPPAKPGRSGGTPPAGPSDHGAGGGGGSKGSGAAASAATHTVNTLLNQAKGQLMKIARENANDKDLKESLDLLDKALDAESFVKNPGKFTGQTLKNLMIKGVFGTLDPARQAFAKRFPDVPTLRRNPVGTGISLEGYEKNYNVALAGLRMPDARKALVAAFVLIGVNDKTSAAEIERRMAAGREMLAKMPGVGQYVEKYYAARDAYTYSILVVNNGLLNLIDEWAKLPAGAADDLRRRGEALGKASETLDDIYKQLMNSKAILVPFFGEYLAEAAFDFQMLAEGFGGVGAQFLAFAGEVGGRKGEYEQEIKQLEARGAKVHADARRAFLP